MLTQVYTGIPHTQRADSVKAAENGTVIESNSKLATEAYQEIIDPTVYNLDFYPYIRMQWDDVQGKNSTVNVLSEHVSQMGLHDIYKISWEQDTGDVNSKYLSAYNVQLRSDQWSVHQRATDGSLGWNRPNQVLPGGSILQLSTNSNNQDLKTTIKLEGWLPTLKSDMQDKVLDSTSSQLYDLTSRVAKMDALKESMVQTISNW